MATAQPNTYGVTWATSKSGQVRIALHAPGTYGHAAQPEWEVVLMEAGSHEILSGCRRFGVDEAAARRYANEQWRNR